MRDKSNWFLRRHRHYYTTTKNSACTPTIGNEENSIRSCASTSLTKNRRSSSARRPSLTRPSSLK